MATLTLRQTNPASGTNKGAPLTNAEVDANFNSLDVAKLEKSGDTLSGTLTLATGSTTIAPLKLVSGTNLTTPVAGAVEFNGTNLFFTPSSTRKTVAFIDSDITGSSGSWTTARTVTFATGDVTGNFSINGTANVSNVPLSIASNTVLTFGGVNVGSATGATTGQIKASGDIIAFSSSDERLKTQVEIIPDALAKVLALRGVTFNWNEAANAMGLEGKDTGVIAQEVAAVLPEVVATREDGHMAVKYDKMIGLLIEAIKDLNGRLDNCNCTK